MKRLRIACFIVILITFALPHTVRAERTRAIAETAVAQWNEAIKTGDVQGILALYGGNALLVQPNGAAVRRPEEIRAFWEALLAGGRDYHRFRIVNVHAENGSVIAAATWSASRHLPTQPAPLIEYHYDGVVRNVFKRAADGTWKIQVQKWN